MSTRHNQTHNTMADALYENQTRRGLPSVELRWRGQEGAWHQVDTLPAGGLAQLGQGGESETMERADFYYALDYGGYLIFCNQALGDSGLWITRKRRTWVVMLIRINVLATVELVLLEEKEARGASWVKKRHVHIPGKLG